MKVAFILRMCAEFDIPMFEEISKLRGVKLHVYFGKGPRNSSWKDADLTNVDFDSTVLKAISLNPGKTNDRYYTFHPALFFRLVAGKYDAVICELSNVLNGFIALVLCKLMKIKFVLHSGGNIRDNAPKSSSPFLKKLYYYVFAKFLIRNSDACAVYCSRSKEFLEYLGAEPRSIFVAPRTIETDLFKRKSEEFEKILNLKRALGVEKKKVVFYAGALERRKRVSDLLMAFAEIQKKRSDIELLIAGDGNIRDDLIEMRKKEKITSVNFLGRINRNDMPYYYALCDVFVLPSQGGVVLNEAMACGRPVVASISDGREADLIIDGENGFIIKEGDIVSLSKYIKIILSSDDLARRMGIKSRQIIDQKFTLQKMAEGFKKALDYAFKSKR